MDKKYQICTRCIMDTTDPEIQFDENGACNHCRRYDEMVKTELHYDAEGQQKLKRLVEKIKQDGMNKRYDCIIGVSGGVDSSFMAYNVKELGLRPLAVHLDNGWDSELAVNNIEQLLKRLGIDLYTYVIDWEEFKDLQVAFLRASTPDSEIPTDHAILATLYEIAEKKGTKYIITGHNVITEGYGVRAWSQGHSDWRYIKSIHEKLGNNKKLETFPHYGMFKFLKYKVLKGMRIIRIMDYIPYVKKDAMRLLEKELGWRPYQGKHYESIYTGFYQSYILPEKFGFDKRKIHLSALIGSGQITREKALEEIKKDLYPQVKLKQDREYIIKKLGLTEEEFESIMSLPIKSFWDYPSYKKLPLLNNKIVLSFYHWLLRR